MKTAFTVFLIGFVAMQATVEAKPVVPDWAFVGAGKYAGTEIPWNDARIPDELSAEFRSGTGRIRGEATVASQQIAGKQLESFGKELRWKIETESAVPSRLMITSRYLGVAADRGPQARLRVIDRTGKVIISRSLLKAKQEIVYLRIFNGKLQVSDLTGRPADLAANPQFPLTLGYGCLVRNVGEECDSRIRLQKDHDLVPVPADLDPNGTPTGILTGLSTRYYIWFGRNHWHLRTTSKKPVLFRGIIRVLNGQLAFVRPVSLDRGRVDTWDYRPKEGELRFVFKSRQNFDGLDFRVVGPDSIVEFDIQTLGKKNPNVVFIGPGQKHPPAVPFTFPARPTIDD